MKTYTEEELLSHIEAHNSLLAHAEDVADLFLEARGLRGGCNASTISFSGGQLWFDDQHDRGWNLPIETLYSQDILASIQDEVREQKRKDQEAIALRIAAEAERNRLQEIETYKKLHAKFGGAVE